MKKDFGVHPFLFPMPTYMVVTYNEDETVDAMAMAWGGICAENMVALNLEEDHKTVANLKARGAFTLSVPGRDTLAESDFMGIASANQDAPIITEYPLTLECKVVEMQDQPYGLRVLGEIVNVLADEAVLDEEGKIDCGKLNTFLFDQMRNDYYSVGEVCGKAWHSGAPFVKKARNG